MVTLFWSISAVSETGLLLYGLCTIQQFTSSQPIHWCLQDKQNF